MGKEKIKIKNKIKIKIKIKNNPYTMSNETLLKFNLRP